LASTLVGTPCDPSILGRSLLPGPVPTFTGNCDVNLPGSFGSWVNNSYTLSVNEAPKFALRYQFLKDIYTKAVNMQQLFKQGYDALYGFLKPCAGPNCSLGGAGAQLSWAASQPSPTTSFPNSVIYGWVDDTPPGGSGGCTDSNGNRAGCAHIVKVTIFSTGRNVGSLLPNPTPPPSSGNSESVLPWIETTTNKSGFLGLSITRKYTLVNRDGWVYVSVIRWDEDHSKSVLFPNGERYGNSSIIILKAIWRRDLAFRKNVKGLWRYYWFWSDTQTIIGLTSSALPITQQMVAIDATALGNAFMLNDNMGGTG